MKKEKVLIDESLSDFEMKNYLFKKVIDGEAEKALEDEINSIIADEELKNELITYVEDLKEWRKWREGRRCKASNIICKQNGNTLFCEAGY